MTDSLIESPGPVLAHRYSAITDPTAPLALLVHGRAGNMQVMSGFFRCLPDNCLRVLPQATQEDQIGGWSWWKVDSKEGSAVVSPDDLQIRAIPAVTQLKDFLTDFEKQHNLTPSHRIAIGFSQGAVLVSAIAQQHLELFDGIALLAGFVLELPTTEYTGKRPEVFIAHGSEDHIVPVHRAQRSRDFLKNSGHQIEYHEEPVKHKIGAKSTRALKDWCHKIL